jgi:hypothetical protein
MSNVSPESTMNRHIAFIAMAFLVAGGCAKKAEFEPLAGITKIRIATDDDQTLKVITAPGEIARIVAFVNAHRGGWEAPWHGVPVPPIAAHLYKGDQIIGHFGVGENFFEAQFDARGSFSQAAAPADCEQFRRLLNLQDVRTTAGARAR